MNQTQTSRKLLVFLFFLTHSLLLFNNHLFAYAEDITFDFTSFNLRNTTLLGDSYLRTGIIGLTRDTDVPTSSSGTVIYNNPIPFYDSEANITASFSTKFTFSISTQNPSSFGDGLTFFISPDNLTLGSPGGYLGLVNSSKLTKNRFIAVEFDTRLDSHFDDPSDNHVGLDIDSLNSIASTNLDKEGILLRSGNPITAWIDYKNDHGKLRVYINHSDFKPQNPVLKVDIDLSEYLKEFMYIGFSGSTEGSTELHVIQSWSFRTFGFLPLRPHHQFQPHNVSADSSFIIPSQNPVPGSNHNNNHHHHHNRVGLVVGIVVPVFCFVIILVSGILSIKEWQKRRPRSLRAAEIVTGPRQFSYKELKEATKCFHSSRIIGRGAFGTVYKAFFVDSGCVSAVKRSKHSSSDDGRAEFLAELSIIACLRHKNLVQLQGWCVEKGELLLVYEFMPNGSLDNVLYPDSTTTTTTIGGCSSDNNRRCSSSDVQPLSWPCRYNIALGLASVLCYLHEECEQQVIHRDIKTSNVMLDANYNPRLGDFGLARLMDHDKSPVSTLTAGTMGYLAPEYLQYGTATEKTDVFSYGIVILELACGRRPIEKEDVSGEVVNLVDYVWSLYGEGKIIESVDKSLNGEFDLDVMKKLLLVGLSCANPDCCERPSMRRVLQVLNDDGGGGFVVPRSKPMLLFSSSLPLSIEDIVSDDDGGFEKEERDDEDLCVIKV